MLVVHGCVHGDGGGCGVGAGVPQLMCVGHDIGHVVVSSLSSTDCLNMLELASSHKSHVLNLLM